MTTTFLFGSPAHADDIDGVRLKGTTQANETFQRFEPYLDRKG